MGSGGCRKQAAAIMRDGRDRVRSIFSISREWSPYYSTARRPWRVQLGYSIRGGRVESTLPLSLSYSSLFLFSLSFSVVLFLSQAGSLLVKIQFVAAHRMENKKTGAVELALRNGRYLTKLFAPQGGGWVGFLSGRG